VTIALVERKWRGHHSTYFKIFCGILLELGHDVFAICPAPEEITTPSGATGRLDIAKFDPPLREIRPRRFQPRFDAFTEIQWLKKTLRDWESAHRSAISLVFFSSIYDDYFQFFPRSARGFPWPWSGLYHQCRSFRLPGSPIPHVGLVPQPEKFLRHPRLHSVGIMDEAAIDYIRGVANGRPAIAFPDFTDDASPAPGGTAEALRLFAAGRPVVGLLGFLQPSKGVATLARAALDSANSDIIFAFIGDIMEYAFLPEERELLNRLKTAPNVFIHFDRIPGEAAFNAVVQACDILFAAYHDFPHSSNILGKAALFQKPVVVSDGFLMAERVHRYSIGEAIPQKDPAAVASALRAILADKPAWLARHNPQWQAYCDTNSIGAAKRSFAQLLGMND
jgi:glycosyltransferase involved in cell wall biosynthesis